ncbi:hypothetical protein D3C87_1080600 [compost metagenome]
MSKQGYTEEFKAEAVKQSTERGHKVPDLSARLGRESAQPLSVDEGPANACW